jgi:mRNA interferase MazF
LEQAGGGYGLVTLAAGAVVLVPFPFSDLSQAKLRPAVILADGGRGDWILCQITSNPYGDPRAVTLSEKSFREGSLRVTSYVRPGKLFTANHSLIVGHVGTLSADAFAEIIRAVTSLFRPTPAG